MIKLLYKPVSILISVAGETLAGVVFKQIWKVAAGENDAPAATDTARSWRNVLTPAALQGAVYGLVKAALDRGAATGTRRLTGFGPGRNGDQPDTEA